MNRFACEGLADGWAEIFFPFFASETGQSLKQFLCERIDAGAVVYPPDPYRVFRMLRPQDVQAVILGQDPYHGPGQATGMAFSVPRELAKMPPSLRNIFKEIARDYGCGMRSDGDLTDWVEQGVLLMNATLSVEEGNPASHAGRGWESLTDLLIERVLACGNPVVFMLWGNYAKAKAPLIEKAAAGDVLILTSNHPSPLSASRPPEPFIGCGHFSAADAWLKSKGRKGIRWQPASELF